MPEGKNKIKQCDCILAKMHLLLKQEEAIIVLTKKYVVYMKKFTNFFE